MKVLFVGFKYDYGLKSRGESLELRAFYPAILNNSIECHSFWLEEYGFPDDINTLQERIINFADSLHPDLIFFVLMKDEIKAKTILYLTSKYKTLNWFCDDQWRFESFTKHIGPCFSYCVTVDKYCIPEYNKIGITPILSQWASFDYIPGINFAFESYNADISFIGSKNLTREWVISELEKRKVFVNCYGSGWQNGKISYEEMKLIFLKSKINLNLSNSVPKDIGFMFFIVKKFFSIVLNPFGAINDKIDFLKHLKSIIFSHKQIEQIKARNFEIPGFGGFQISKFALQLEDYFENGKEIVLFSDMDELTQLVRFYLENDSLREKIRCNGYFKSANHSYSNRISLIFNEIRSMNYDKN
jgi:spore maturation protein CgeB